MLSTLSADYQTSVNIYAKYVNYVKISIQYFVKCDTLDIREKNR